MKIVCFTALALALFAAPVSAAQLYRWVDEKGRVEWRDTPPPAHAKNVERRDMSGSTIETSTLPYSVQQAVKNHPVTLWVYDCGDPCAKARAHLARRGVPHTERNPQQDAEAMKKTTGGLDVPVLVVGSNQFKGYLESAWESALDSAGYPRTPPPGMKKPQTAAKTGGNPPASKSAPAPKSP